MSIRFQADADLNLDIVKAVRQQEPAIDFASAADSQLRGVKDPELLELAAVANRVLVSHDRRTMLDHFRTRLAAGKSSPGVLIVSQGASIGLVAEAIVYIWSMSDPSELSNQIKPITSHRSHATCSRAEAAHRRRRAEPRAEPMVARRSPRATGRWWRSGRGPR